MTPKSFFLKLLTFKGGYDPCADDKTEDALYKRHSGHENKEIFFLTAIKDCGPIIHKLFLLIILL